MSEKEKTESGQSVPPPPQNITDPDRIDAGEERWRECPLKDCKHNHELLYEDFYLRGIRTNRLMCSACAVRVEVGYVARETAKAQDDKFFDGTRLDDVIIFFTTLILSFVANSGLILLHYWYIGILLGFGAGWLVSIVTNRLIKGRSGRRSQQVAIAGVIIGTLTSIPVLFAGYLAINLFITLNSSIYPVGGNPAVDIIQIFVWGLIPEIICTAVMVYLVRNIFRH